MNGFRFQLPRARPGDRLTASAWNSLVESVNGVLRRPRQQGGDVPADLSSDRDFFVPILGQTEYSGRIENEEDSEQYVDVIRRGALRVVITSEMLPIAAGDTWIIGRELPTIPEDFTKVRDVEDDLGPGAPL